MKYLCNQNQILQTFILSFLIFGCSSNMLMERVSDFDKKNHYKESQNLMIASQGHYASTAAKNVVNKGGNIIDAMAAISFVISVERPQSTGIGGGGFLLFHSKEHGKTFAFDFREKAPIKSTKNMYLNGKGRVIKGKSVDGIFAVAVPGLVKGILDIHEKYGKLSRAQVIEDAINLAKNGFKVYPGLSKALSYRKDVLCKFKSSAKIFCPNGNILKTGDLLIQSDLAKTLQRIANKGNKDFYFGETAKRIVETSKEYNGLIRHNDLKKYNVKQRDVIKGQFRDHEIVSMSPPSSGGIHIIQILNILENIDLASSGQYSPKTIHYVSQAMELAFADRAKYLGDSDFVKVPMTGLTSKEYAKELFAKIKKDSAFKKDALFNTDPFKHEPDHTTHFSIMDKEGNVVVSTQTINGYFGSGLVANGTGIVLNNEMDDFSTKPGASNIFGAIGSEKNSVEPGKRPLSSMSPSIVLKDGEPVLALGTPNGTRILTCVMQTILNFVEFKKPIYEAVASARYHHQWRPHYIRMETADFPKSTIDKLKSFGHEIKFSDYGCRIQAISRDKILRGVSDPRGEGKVIGL